MKNKESSLLYILFILAIICFLALYIYTLTVRSHHPIENCSSILTKVGKNRIFKKEITKIEIKHGYDYITTLTEPEDIQKICNFVKQMSGYKFSDNVLVTTYVYGINIYAADGDFLLIGLSPADFRIRKSYDGDIYFYNSDKVYYDEFKDLLNTIIEKKS